MSGLFPWRINDEAVQNLYIFHLPWLTPDPWLHLSPLTMPGRYLAGLWQAYLGSINASQAVPPRPLRKISGPRLWGYLAHTLVRLCLFYDTGTNLLCF